MWDAEVEIHIASYASLFAEERSFFFFSVKQEGSMISFGNSVADLPGAEIKGNRSFLFLFNTSTETLLCSLSKIHFKLRFQNSQIGIQFIDIENRS